MEKKRVFSSVFSPLSMIMHAIAAQPARGAGALVAVNAIKDAIPIIHGPKGCAALRMINSFSVNSLFPYNISTDLTEAELIFGAEEKLRTAIIETYKRYKPSIIIVIPTCPTDMTGEDIGAAVDMAKKEVGCEVVYSTGELIQGRPIGYHDVLYSLFDQLFDEKKEYKKIKDSVNLITFPIHSSNNKLSEAQEILEEIGIRVNKIFFFNTKLKDIYELPKAQLNITDSEPYWIKLIEKKLGIPYYVISSFEQSPYGIGPLKRIFLEISKAFKKEENAKKILKKKEEELKEKLMPYISELKDLRIAVVGGLFSGIGKLLLELSLKPGLLIYKTYGLESHGMSFDAIKVLIEKDKKVLKNLGIEPEVMINPKKDDEIKKIKELGIDIVITGSDRWIYHAEGIRAFDSLFFYMNHLKIGFSSVLELAKGLKKELEKKPKDSPLLSLLDYDEYRSDFHPLWRKAEKVWRTVTEGADGGCIYG